jgi:hypothetical protein
MTLATARLRFLFLAAKIWGHGRVGVSYSDHLLGEGGFPPLAASASLYCIGERWFLAGAENGTDVMREGSLF